MRRAPSVDFDMLDRSDVGDSDQRQQTIIENVESESGPQAQGFAPPPHLMARWYRSSNRCNKSSTTSSRRSSISSLHSHHSSRSCHGGPQSSHVAQHLRRASILEARKARLADRAAHAEKVRLRAALAKVVSHSDFEEKALLAQRAREKYLAEITARCEEEVRRAKKIAEEMKERKAAENAKLRDDMEERFAEAEKRRLLYLQTPRRRRNTSLPPVLEKKSRSLFRPCTNKAAALVIQCAWRRHQRRRILNQFIGFNLTEKTIRDMPFEVVGHLISSENVLATTTKLLDLLNVKNIEAGAQGDHAAARVFLSAFLILGQGSHVFSHDGEQEEDLKMKAEELLSLFDEIVQTKPAVITGPLANADQLEMFSETFSTFSSAFEDWKAHDSSALMQVMLDQFISLHNIWQSVKNDTEGGVAAEYRQGIRMNQMLLLTRMKKLAGPEKALGMVQDALRKIKRERAKPKTRVRDVTPRALSTQKSLVAKDLLSVSDACGTRTIDNHLGALPTYRGEVDPATGNAGSSASKAESAESSIDDTPMMEMLTSIPDNRTLVHELAINKEFVIEPPAGAVDQMYEKFCRVLRKDIAQGKGYLWTVGMARVIRDKLLHLVPEGKSMYQLISEALDPEIILNQCWAGNFSYDQFFSFMSTILLKLCAPVHDSEVQAFADDTHGDIVDRLARLLKIIDTICLDYANFMLQIASPQLLPEASSYERQAFEQDLKSGVITLEKTEKWWRQAGNKLIEELSRRDPEGINPNVMPTFQQIYSTGLVDLAISNSPWSDEKFPETLHLDVTRLRDIREQCMRIVLIASILLTSKNLLKRDVRSQWKAEAERMWDALSTSTSPVDASQILPIISSSHSLPPSTKSQLQSLITRLLSQLTSNQLTDPVSKVLFSRLRSHVLARLNANSASERVKLASTAQASLARAGLAEPGDKIRNVVELLERLGRIDGEAHGMWYEEIAKRVSSEREQA